MQEALPQIIFILLLFINFFCSVINPNRNSLASFIATTVLVALTWWGGFFQPLIDVLIRK